MMKRIALIFTAAIILASCSTRSGEVPIPPAWALGFWTFTDEGTDAGDVASAVTALRGQGKPADAFVISADDAEGFVSEQGLYNLREKNARAVVDLRGKPSDRWESIKEYFDADGWIVDDVTEMKGLLDELSKDRKRPFLLSSMDPGKEMLGVARMIASGEGWEGLRNSLKEGLELSRKGVPYWLVEPADSLDNELLIRSTQLQTFFPVPAIHVSAAIPQQAFSAIAMRYTITPFVYTTAAKVFEDGGTIATPLDVAFPDDPKAAGIDDEFIFGGNALVCPVLEAGVTEREVYLPAGCAWFDYVKGEKYDGGTTVTIPAGIDDIPVFCREGSMIVGTMSPGYYISRPAAIHAFIYPGADAEYVVYEDDGLSNGYLKGRSAELHIKWSEENRTVTVFREGKYAGMTKDKQVIAVATGIGSVVIDYTDGVVTKPIQTYK